LDLLVPLGGIKASGWGREFGPEGLTAYQSLKSIYRLPTRRLAEQSAHETPPW